MPSGKRGERPQSPLNEMKVHKEPLHPRSGSEEFRETVRIGPEGSVRSDAQEHEPVGTHLRSF